MPLEHSVRPIHLRPTAEIAERVLLPGDPARALAVAQELLSEPRMSNHSRGLWGYTGLAPDADPLTVQATGMGGPSAAIVVDELIELGARRLIRIGTCGALGADLALGDLLAAEAVVRTDGTSAALGAPEVLRPDPEMTAGLVSAGARAATVVSTDLFYDRRGLAAGWLEQGAVAVEMEAAAVLQVARMRRVSAACLLVVTDVPTADGSDRIEPGALEQAERRLGEVGYASVRSR